MNTLKRLRLALGTPVDSLARAVNISTASYWDLENLEHELEEALSLTELTKLATELRVAPSALFSGAPCATVTTETLAQAIREYLASRGESVSDFEDKVGWDVAEALKDPGLFLGFNVDGLRAVCEAVGIDWLGVLDGVS